MPRKPFHPTEENRRLAKSLAGVAIPHDDIALKLGLSPKTLRKYFRNELSLGSIEAEANVRGRIYRDAMAGNSRAQQLWVNNISRHRGESSSRTPVQPPSFNVITQPPPEQSKSTAQPLTDKTQHSTEVQNNE